jgi:CubicO group peptidase (beta-lactamase class C family)
LRSWKIPAAEQIGTRPLTVRQLLSHTAGLSVHGFDGYSIGSRIPSVVEVLNGTAPANSPPVRIEIPPGSGWRYSGGGYTVIQRLIEDVSGEPFAKFMQGKVLAELGMTASTFSQVVHASTQRASGHQPGGQRIPGKARIYPEQAAAGLWTTPEDLARYLVYVQRAVHGTSGALLNQQLASDMLTLQNEGSHGLGPEVYAVGEFGRFGHNGVNAGFESAIVAYIDGGRGLVVMTNSNGAAMFFDEIKGSVARTYNWPGFPIRPQVEVQPITAELRHRSAGKYRTDMGDIAELTVRNRRLFLVLPGVGSYEVFAKSDAEILAPQLGWKEFTLVRNGDRVTALKIDNGSRWNRID